MKQCGIEDVYEKNAEETDVPRVQKYRKNTTARKAAQVTCLFYLVWKKKNALDGDD